MEKERRLKTSFNLHYNKIWPQKMVALEVLDTDLSKWSTEQKYVSWLNLCPNRKISGGKLISGKRLKKKPNFAAQAFRMAANSLMASNNWLGDYFRRIKAKGGHK